MTKGFVINVHDTIGCQVQLEFENFKDLADCFNEAIIIYSTATSNSNIPQISNISLAGNEKSFISAKTIRDMNKSIYFFAKNVTVKSTYNMKIT